MHQFRLALIYPVLALAAGTVSLVSVANERSASFAQWAEAAARQGQEAQRLQRKARLLWEYERRRSAAHARMPETLYASTPDAPAKGDLSCPALDNEKTSRVYPGLFDRDGRGRSVFDSRRPESREAGITVYPAARQNDGVASWGSSSSTPGDKESHRNQESGWTVASVQHKSGTATTHHVFLVPSASEALRGGFVRVINHSAEAGEVRIDPVDDGGRAYDTITLSIDANETVHFNSGDLELGNEGKGLTGSTGSGEGDWRLVFTSDLDIEVLSYIRTTDGFLTAMHDVVPWEGDVGKVAIFNPGSNRNQVSHLRLINPTDAMAEVTIRGIDDKGTPGAGEVSLSLDAGTAREITAEQLEEGATGLAGMLGDGSGKWRLEVESAQSVVAISLLESPTDHLTNLSTVPDDPEDDMHSVPLFPAAGDPSGRQGFVRVINNSGTGGEVSIEAYDETERDYGTLILIVGANEVVQFNSDDLEQGSPGKGLSGGTGAGEGDWRLQFSSDLDIEVLSYIRTEDGFLTAMHDVAPSAGNRHRVAVFNPGSNRNQESLLRLINPSVGAAEVTITGVDDKGAAGSTAVSLSVPAGGTRTVGAWDLESGAEALNGALGDGAGKWQLMIESDQSVEVMSLLRSPTGHMMNLSTAPVRGARGGAAQEPQTAETVFQQLISGPIVQSKCIACHVEGGASGNTRLVFVTDQNPDHEAINLQVFKDLLDVEKDGASYILNKIQGALGHGGGIQVAAGTGDYVNMERFLSLLGEDVGPLAITPETLFDGVTMESARSTLRRAAIVFAGRIPTDAEYDSIRTGGMMSLRAAIRGLMKGPEFHEFLIRGSNDRLFTDRDFRILESDGDGFVGYPKKTYNLREANATDGEYVARNYVERAQYGFRRAAVELIAHVGSNDLPYTEILTADYVMANPMAAEAYGASTVFDDPSDPHEFRPSKIVDYYRPCDGRVVESREFGYYVVDPGPCPTDYPHAGILNTKVFLQRYPTTPTNRNRARSRWTYYHFAGLDIEKSASRTTDPVALADTDNPTFNNPSCTVCHTVMDPVAGAFQNYGNEGLYRDQWGGKDALDEFYKFNPSGRSDVAVSARSRETSVVDLGRVRLFSHNENELGLKNLRTFEGDRKLHLELGEVVVRSSSGEAVDRFEVKDVASENACGDARDESYFLNDCRELLVLPLAVSEDGDYDIEVEAWVIEEGEKAATLQAWMPGPFFREGDNWYRDMRTPGFDGELAPNPENSLQWLASKVAADERFATATVKFWWPSVMGSEAVNPPEDENDADFDGMLLASNAQTAEIERLAAGFRHGFEMGSPYNLKDLLVEIVLSNWFRAETMSDDDAVRAAALRHAGARRLLTPEELARKTDAITGFQWERWVATGRAPPFDRKSALTDHDDGYRLLYGGIDSGGITDRARDITSIMAGVARSHAAESSCPIVLRELYLLPGEERRLLGGIERTLTPATEFFGSFDIGAASRTDAETLSLSGHLRAGESTLSVSFVNDYYEEETRDDRNVRLDRMDLRDGHGEIVSSHEFEDVVGSGCGGPAGDHFNLACAETVAVPLSVPADGRYDIEILAWADQAGDELPQVEVGVESDVEASAGAMAIRKKLAELHERLLGVEVGPDSEDVEASYRLFVDVWERKRQFENTSYFEPTVCNFGSDHRFLDGILEDALVKRENEDGGHYYDWHWDRVNDFIRREVDPRDPNGVARTWVVVLAYLMMDYRYLYL